MLTNSDRNETTTKVTQQHVSNICRAQLAHTLMSRLQMKQEEPKPTDHDAHEQSFSLNCETEQNDSV